MIEVEDKQSENKQSESKRAFSFSRLDFFKSFTDGEKSLKIFSTRHLLLICSLVFLGFVIYGKIKEVSLNNQIAILKEKISKVDSLYRIDSTEYHDLKNTPSLIEHIAREDYYMKEAGEEIYIIKKAENNEQED